MRFLVGLVCRKGPLPETSAEKLEGKIGRSEVDNTIRIECGVDFHKE